jgi:4-hydroxy-tetrahydrodipicolinate synthase
MRPKFHGVAPALVTPMHEDGSINYDGLKSLIQHVSDGGVDYLVVQGTTGESATTSKDEKKRVLNLSRSTTTRTFQSCTVETTRQKWSNI